MTSRAIGLGAVVVTVTVIGLFSLTWGVMVGLVGPLLFVAALVVLSVWLISATARAADFTGFRALAWCGLAVKVAGTVARYLVARDVYGGGDAELYVSTAVTLGERIHDGVWSLAGTPLGTRPTGTQSVSWVLGTFFSGVGPSEFLGYVLFSWVGWVGLLLFYRAFRVLFPEVSSRPFALLILFLPSFVYWPSTIGKEALMIGLIGAATFGLARVLTATQGGRGLVLLVAAGVLAAFVRPHIVLILLGSAMVAAIVGRSSGTGRGGVGRAVVVVLLVPALAITFTRMDQLIGGDKGDTSVNALLAETERRTTTGGSAFEAQPVRSPLDLPLATMSVLFRPWPWQAGGGPAFVASLESVLLAGLMVRNWRLLGRIPAAAWNRRGVGFALAFSILFVVAFSNVGNAGILARQRTQVMPFVLLAVCGAARPRREEQERRDGDSIEAELHESSSVSPARRFEPGITPA